MEKQKFDVTLNQGQIAKLREKALAAGIASSNSGTLPAYHGVSLSYGIETSVDDGSAVVHFTVESKPWWLPESTIENKVHDFIDTPAQSV